MMNFLKKSELDIIILQLAVSLLFFLLYSGFNYEILYFENFSWFLKPSITNDIETYWISWEFFRNTDIFQFPLFLNPDYGNGFNVSIYHTDAIPIAAFTLRFFTDFLPVNFQYLGLWSFMSFFLMLFFSYKLLNIFIPNKLICFISSTFFLIAPPFIDRVFLQQAVSSHWLVIASLYFYYSNQYSYKIWNLILIISILINGYLATIVFAVFIASTFINYYKSSKLVFFKKVFFTLSFMILVSYSTGLFSIGKGLKEGGFELYGMSLLGFVNPSSPTGFYSVLINKLLSSNILFVKEVEGFAFLGAGILILIFIVLINFKTSTKAFKSSIPHLPLIVLSFILLIYSFSNNIFFLGNVDFLGSQRLFVYTVPEILEPLVKVFRASGRFSWLLFYLIYLFTFIGMYQLKNKKNIVLILSLILLFQVVDNYKIINIFKNELKSDKVYTTAIAKMGLKDPIWKIIEKDYKKINIYPIKNKPKDYTRIAFFASEKGLSTNFGYFSRINHTIEERLNNKMINDFNKGTFNEKIVYIIQDDVKWDLLNELYSKDSLDFFIKEVDGYRLFIPNLTN
tara:strand:- start:122 stop:1822 length:1701 start_codon:yes stop_codon:yes gene_type:complete